MTIQELLDEAHATAIEKGWWDGGIESRSVGDQFANFHAEVSEAWEEWRKYGMDGSMFIYKPGSKPEGIAVELADLLIRVADTCAAYKIPIEQAIRMKMDFNRGREHRHGGKLA